MWLLLPLAIVAPPIAGLLLTQELPHPQSSTGSGFGLLLFPFVAAFLVFQLARRADPGARRTAVVTIGSINSVLWLLLIAIGMIAA